MLPEDPSFNEIAAAVGIEPILTAPGDHGFTWQVEIPLYWPEVPAGYDRDDGYHDS